MDFLTIINFLGLIYVIFRLHSLQGSRGPTSSRDIGGSADQPVVQIPHDLHPDSITHPDSYYAKTDRPVVTVPTTSYPSHQEDRGPDAFSRFFTWFQIDWQLKVGALFILLGFVWFVTYAFANNWIGPVGRIMLGFTCGVAILVYGVHLIRTRILQAEIILSLGAAILMITVYSGRNVYGMFTSLMAFVMFAAISYTMATLSYVYRRQKIALLGLLIGAITPILIGSTSRNDTGLLTYVFIIVVSYIWLARQTSWKSLLILGAIVTAIYTLPLFQGFYESYLFYKTYPSYYATPSMISHAAPFKIDISVMRFFAVLFSLTFFGISLASQIYEKKTEVIHTLISAVTGWYSIYWVMQLYPSHLHGLLITVVALVFFLCAHLITTIHKLHHGQLIYSLVAIAMLIMATVIEFGGTIRLFALATETVVLLIYFHTTYGDRMSKLLFLPYGALACVGFLQLYDIGPTHLAHTIATLYLNLALYVPYVYLRHIQKTTDSELIILTRYMTIAAGVLTLLIYWYFLAATTLESFTVNGVVLTTYAVIGLAMYIKDQSKEGVTARYFGLALTVFVIGRLLLVEVWGMALSARIITFFVIGLLLVLSVLWRKKHVTSYR